METAARASRELLTEIATSATERLGTAPPGAHYRLAFGDAILHTNEAQEVARAERRLAAYAAPPQWGDITCRVVSAPIPDAWNVSALGLRHVDGQRQEVRCEALGDEGARVVLDSDASDTRYPSGLLVLNKSNATAVVFSERAHPLSAHVCVRTVRNLLLGAVARRGAAFLHGALIDVNGRGLLLVGDKFAGKTTMALSLLKRHDVNFVSNDKVVALSSTGVGHDWPVVGAPTAMGVWEDVVAGYPELPIEETVQSSGHYGRGNSERAGEKMRRYFLEPSEVAAAFGRRFVPSTSLELIAVLERGGAEQELAVQPANAAELASLIRLDDVGDKGRLFPVDTAPAEPFWQRFRSATNSLRAVRVRYGAKSACAAAERLLQELDSTRT